MRNNVHGELRGVERQFFRNGYAAAKLKRFGDSRPAQVIALRARAEEKSLPQQVFVYPPKQH